MESTPRALRLVKTPTAPRRLFKPTKRIPRTVVDKRIIKFLSICSDPKTFRLVVREAPESVIKTVCNAAFNAERGDVRLTNAEKALFRKHRRQIATLTSHQPSVAAKRKLLGRVSQSGGSSFVPALLSAVLGSLGSRLFSVARR